MIMLPGLQFDQDRGGLWNVLRGLNLYNQLAGPAKGGRFPPKGTVGSPDQIYGVEPMSAGGRFPPWGTAGPPGTAAGGRFPPPDQALALEGPAAGGMGLLEARKAAEGGKIPPRGTAGSLALDQVLSQADIAAGGKIPPKGTAGLLDQVLSQAGRDIKTRQEMDFWDWLEIIVRGMRH